MPTVEDVWYKVEGTIVGWLSDPDGTGEVMVVSADKVNDKDWGKCSKPSFTLRWIGHDYDVIESYLDSRVPRANDSDVGIGDWVRFTTCDREQEEYASGQGEVK